MYHRMNKTIALLLALLMCIAQPVCAGLADENVVSVFDFVNAYDKPTTQSTLSDAELAALTSAPNDVYETERAKYTLKQYAFDGCNVYLLVEVAPKADDVLLMSDYMYEPTDPRMLEDSEVTETFEQKAARDGQKIIASGIGVDITDPKIAYFGSNASEKYFSDGTMLLELEFVFREDMADAPRGIDIRIREYEYGAEWEEYAWPITITPITHMTVARAA